MLRRCEDPGEGRKRGKGVEGKRKTGIPRTVMRENIPTEGENEGVCVRCFKNERKNRKRNSDNEKEEMEISATEGVKYNNAVGNVD